MKLDMFLFKDGLDKEKGKGSRHINLMVERETHSAIFYGLYRALMFDNLDHIKFVFREIENGLKGCITRWGE